MVSFALTSCGDKDSEGKSRFTTYAVLTMNGEDFVKLNVGDTFNDEGCVADMGGQDVTDKIIVHAKNYKAIYIHQLRFDFQLVRLF